MADGPRRNGVVIQVIELGGGRFVWAMRKGDNAPFLRSNGHFSKAMHAESNARQVVARANKKVAYVEAVSEPSDFRSAIRSRGPGRKDVESVFEQDA